MRRCHGGGHRVRGRLQHRLFLWFGLSILLTGLVVATAMHLAGGSASAWREEMQRARHFVGGRFAAVWSSPSERDALARAAARDLEVEVTLSDSAGATLARFGPACRRHPRWRVPVTEHGRSLGALTFCSGRFTPDPLRLLLGVGVACVVLWLASGWIARRLARPHVKLAQVARDIGAGRLHSRAELDCREHGEAGLLADSINEMAVRIERQLAEQRELLAAVSHELRTPLQRMRVLVEILRDGGGDPERLTQLENEVLEIDHLVGELLAGARLDFTALSPRPLDAAAVAGEALERAGLGAELLLVEAADPRFVADPTLVARALANLVDNARKHGGGLTGLRVRAPDGGTIAFEAEDRGAGLPPGHEEQVFDAFRQLADAAGEQARADRRAESLGLGLALVRRIAEAHGGKAFARNREGGGACIGFSLPRGAAS